MFDRTRPETGGPDRIAVTATRAPDPGLEAQWRALSDYLPEANPFSRPWCLGPALAAWGEGVDLLFVHRGERLAGVVPMIRASRLRGMPIPHYKLWTHRHCFLSAPLIDPGDGPAVWQAVVGWARGRGGQVLDLPLVPRDDPAMLGLGGVVIESFERAVFRPHPEGAEAGLIAATSAKSRKRWRRLRRQLEEQGELSCERLPDDAEPGPWIAEFLRLEADGWKGRDGTAMACTLAEAAFFTEMAMRAHAEGALHILRLRLGDRTIASQVNLFSRGLGYAFKVAFDERFAAQSPGVLLELEAMADFQDRPGLVAVDSCTMADHKLMDRLWTGSRRIERVLVPTGLPAGRVLCSALRLKAVA